MPIQAEKRTQGPSSSLGELVSIGIPCYNRAKGLDSALRCLTAQTHRNLEIIISDNSSTDPEVIKVIKRWEAADHRIRAFRQHHNLGPIENFRFVLGKAQGEYFMWAADDDEYSQDLVDNTYKFLAANKNYAAVSMEAQYVTEQGPMPFVAEGEPFYHFQSSSSFQRVIHMLKYNYGNLFYGLYRKDFITQAARHFATNEIPFFVKVSEAGNWKVLPDIKVFKKTSAGVYWQVVWENQGGKLTNTKYSWKYLIHLSGMWRYHQTAGLQIMKALQESNLNKKDITKLKIYAWLTLINHFLCFVSLRKKPKYQNRKTCKTQKII